VEFADTVVFGLERVVADGFDCGAGGAFVPGPGVAEPEGGEEPEVGGIGPRLVR